jgi:LAO/AO transport system kinase
MQQLVERVLAGDLRALARAASMVEDRREGAGDLMRALFPHTGRAAVIGITGPPGAGKSTLADQLAAVLRAEGKSTAIIAVDPSSPYSGGAILGDRIRMQRHHDDDGVFIRSMATRGWMGGLARATTDMAMLFDAAGRDVVMVETVGVGQDEVEVARLADATVVVLVPGLGDDVQAIKAGLLEIADVFVVNKSDLPGAERLENEIAANLALSHRSSGWVPPIVRTVASDGTGIGETLAAVRGYLKDSEPRSRAVEIWMLRLREMLRERLLDFIDAREIRSAAAEVAAKTRDPYTIIEELLRRIQEGQR